MKSRPLVCAALLVLLATAAGAQVRPHAPVKGVTEPDDPANPTPAAREFHDSRYGLTLHIPAGWNFERKDGVLSNFGQDVRTTHRNLDVRGVASLNFNPYPVSTFSGATFYYSAIARSDAASCLAQATTGHLKPQKDAPIAGLSFKHGEDHHGVGCTESRDEVFTAMKAHSCLRFDLVVNTFCSQSSGAMEITPAMLTDVQTRLANILGSLKIDK